MSATDPSSAAPTERGAARYAPGDLRRFAESLLAGIGMAGEPAAAVADVLVEGDLLGRSTHGMALLAAYLRELEGGRMATSGEPRVIQDRGSALTWDGMRLPGPWLVRRAIAAARARLAEHPVATVVIRRSHHIAALQAYLKDVTDAGLVILLTCSDPSTGGVAPHGAVASRYTPNPIAAGFPTEGDPILIDISTSTTTNAMTRGLATAGDRLPGPWLVDADGRASDDPAVLFGDRPGAILPLGGLDLGHKGFALGLLVEALTSALGGFGRVEAPREWSASIFLQVIDPDGFGGAAAFRRQLTWLGESCRSAPVASGHPPVRLPGEAALARRTRQLQEGITLAPAVVAGLTPWAERFGVALPSPLVSS